MLTADRRLKPRDQHEPANHANGNTSYPGVSGYPGVTVPADGNWHQISVTGYNMSSALRPGDGLLVFADRSGVGQRLWCRSTSTTSN